MAEERWWSRWRSRKRGRNWWSGFRWFRSWGNERQHRAASSSGVIELSLLVFGGFALLTQTVMYRELLGHRHTQRALQEKVAFEYRLEGALAEARYLVSGMEELDSGLSAQSAYFPELTIEVDGLESTIYITGNDRTYLEADFTTTGNSVTIVKIVSLSNRPYSR